MTYFKTRLFKSSVIILLLSWAAGGIMSAQSGSTAPRPKTVSTDIQTQISWKLRGRVVDRNGQPIADAVVELKNNDRGYRKEVKTGADGLLYFSRVLALKNETYDISVSADKYLTRTGKIMFPPKIPLVIEMNRDPRLAVRELLVQAEATYLAGDFAGAKKKYEEVLIYNFASAIGELGCGLCERNMGNHDAAQEHMEKAVALAKTAPDPKTETAALEYLGDLMVSRLDLAKALEYFLAALELGYERTDALAVKIGDILVLQKHPAQALFYYNKALSLNPSLEMDLAGKIGDLPASGITDMPPAQAIVPLPQSEEPISSDGGYDEKLRKLLSLAASYCQKLEHAAFRYFCLEDVVEVTSPGWPYAIKNTYRFDFQIVGGKKRIVEKRKLIMENGQKADDANTTQRTIFQSHLKYYAPIDLLGAANQGRYYYWILKEESIDGVPCIVVGIEARAANPDKLPLEGEAAISTRDGSVLRIHVAQNSIEGLAERLQIAREQGFDDVLIQDIHWFEKEMKGLRFPSRSELREIYLLDRMKTMHYTVSYSYSAYTFFDVRITGIEIGKKGSKKKSAPRKM
jgi:tetratricopeptide (TPR) repeat protein